MKYGFISGGGGSWYSQTLKLLAPGDLVWVKIPKTGYVGVGRVTEAVRAAKDFNVSPPDGDRSALDVLQDAARYRKWADDPEMSEYFSASNGWKLCRRVMPSMKLGCSGIRIRCASPRRQSGGIQWKG